MLETISWANMNVHVFNRSLVVGRAIYSLSFVGSIQLVSSSFVRSFRVVRVLHLEPIWHN